MTKLEYIRASHREANRKIRVWLDGVQGQLDGRSRVLGWLWRVVAWIIYAVVRLFGGFAFVDALFRGVRYTLHFMECEIGDKSPEEAHGYLLSRQQEYARRLSYGSVPVKEQKRIDNTFDYLFKKYPAPAPPVEESAPDPAAERHTQMIETITEAKTAIVESVATSNNRREERHAQVVGGIAEVKTAMDSVAGYTGRKDREDAERQQKEADALAAAEKRRERHKSWSGFEPHPEDFGPKLSDAQIALLTERMNEIGVFKRDVTPAEITRLLLCEHTEPLQTTHNKMIALLLEQLSTEGLITPKWQMVADHKNCFTSKQGKHLTAKDLSAAKQTSALMKDKKYTMILDSIEAVKRAR